MKLVIDTTDSENVKLQCVEFDSYELGLALGKEFHVKSCHPEGNCVGCFSKYGFEGRNQTSTANVAVFLLLLTGKAVIVDD